MNILFLSPGFPTEMTDFVRGLAQAGATVIGLGDQPEFNLPEKARQALSAYYQVSFSQTVRSHRSGFGDLARGCGSTGSSPSGSR